MKIYVAGPMTGHPQFNFPNFARVTAALRRAGHEVVSPIERDSPEVQAACLASADGAVNENNLGGETMGEIYARDIKIITDEAIDCILLMEGWEKSRGARLEAFVGIGCDCLFLLEVPPVLSDANWVPIDAGRVMAAIYQAVKEKIRGTH